MPTLTFPAQLLSGATTSAALLIAMALVALIETVLPLRARGRWGRTHLGPNFALTFLTFATNIFFNAALVLTLVWLAANGFGLLNAFELPALLSAAVVLVVLDFSFYIAHVAMHRIQIFWRFHRVHHSDPFVDVTTTIRQHPGEGVIRYVFLAAFAFALGASPAAFALYRASSALNGLLEHANFQVPAWLDRALSLITTWPSVHKIHHSRAPQQTDTNYGNLFSFFDRMFGTFTPTEAGAIVPYGLDGFDDPATQTTAGLLAVPFRNSETTGASPWLVAERRVRT